MSGKSKDPEKDLNQLMKELTYYFNSLEDGQTQMNPETCHNTLEKLYDSVHEYFSCKVTLKL